MFNVKLRLIHFFGVACVVTRQQLGKLWDGIGVEVNCIVIHYAAAHRCASVCLCGGFFVPGTIYCFTIFVVVIFPMPHSNCGRFFYSLYIFHRLESVCNVIQ